VFDSDSEYSGISVSNEDLQGLSADGSTFTDCRFQTVEFAGASFVRTSFEQCAFTGCDLSNANLSDAAIDTVVFRDCKLMGASFAEATLRGVQASGCLARLVSFFQASLRNTTLIDCDLNEGDFRGGRLVDTALVRCDLSSVSFGRADVQRLDLRGSMLDGSFSLADAKGFVVGTDQLLVLALALARSVGTSVNDDEVPGPGELPGARETATLVVVDPGAAKRGLREARAQLGRES
jgi:uncharacterized protein YjbI with pentapeptide repeats